MADRVVVGVDGSEGSRKALRWAANDARRREAELRVINVHTTSFEPTPYRMSYVAARSHQVVERMASSERRWREHQRLAGIQEAEALLDELVDELPAELRHEVAIEAIPREGTRPADELLEAARSADLLVVGSRGRGGFKGLLLGSVSQQLAQHAPCPIVIVHDTDQTTDLTDP